MGEKYHLHCRDCGQNISGFREWFAAGQRCPGCRGSRAEARYADMEFLKGIGKLGRGGSLWSYFELLPVDKPANVVTCGEGNLAIDHWPFLDACAKDMFGVDCRFYAHRHDNCYATGTFKDLAASVAASVLKENGITDYVVSSTGNIGVAFARYLAEAGITLYAFLPRESSDQQQAEISCFGQKVFLVMGDYARAKDVAAQFAERHGFSLSAGTFDPMRVEAKKTMAYEWKRRMNEEPTVYIQALSGGTGPIGVHKGCREMMGAGALQAMPRFILAQSDRCDPMARGLARARDAGFPEGWEKEYPVIASPETGIVTLSTGDPTAYPVLAPLVRETGGSIVSVPEEAALDYAGLVAFESAVRIGPAAAIAVGGVFSSLKQGLLRNGDVVLVNIGEGMRRAPEFMARMRRSVSVVGSVRECEPFDRNEYRDQLWRAVLGE